MHFHLRQRETLKGLHNLNHKQLVVRILQPRPLSSCSCHIDRVTVSLPAAFLPLKTWNHLQIVHLPKYCTLNRMFPQGVFWKCHFPTGSSRNQHIKAVTGTLKLYFRPRWMTARLKIFNDIVVILKNCTVSGTQKSTLWAPDSKMNVNIAQMFPFCRLYNQTVCMLNDFQN